LAKVPHRLLAPPDTWLTERVSHLPSESPGPAPRLAAPDHRTPGSDESYWLRFSNLIRSLED